MVISSSRSRRRRKAAKAPAPFPTPLPDSAQSRPPAPGPPPRSAAETLGRPTAAAMIRLDLLSRLDLFRRTRDGRLADTGADRSGRGPAPGGPFRSQRGPLQPLPLCDAGADGFIPCPARKIAGWGRGVDGEIDTM